MVARSHMSAQGAQLARCRRRRLTISGSIPVAQARQNLGTVVLLLALQAGLPAQAHADGGHPVSTTEAMRSGWDAFVGMVACGWSDMTKAVSELPTLDVPSAPTIVHVRRACQTSASDRTTDCSAAAHFVCRQQGFDSGHELDVESGRVCRLTGSRLRSNASPATCKPKSWITQAACW